MKGKKMSLLHTRTNVTQFAGGNPLRSERVFIRSWAVVFIFALFAFPHAVNAQNQTEGDPAQLTLEEKEVFLRKGKVVAEKLLGIGVTNSLRATLEYKGMQHYAHIQTIDITRKSAETERGKELMFRDFYGFNIAAYELDKLLGLNMTPASVERRYKGERAAYTWWVDNVAMMEGNRVRDNIQPPDMENWRRQMYIVQIINQLIYDTDPNAGNLLITKDWKLWTIDRTRAFRPHKSLEQPELLKQCERRLLARLKELNEEILKTRLKKCLTSAEIAGLDARRELIVKHFEEKIRTLGEAEVLFDLPPKD